MDEADKALNPRQKSSISLISFLLCIFLLLPIHTVEIADYSGNTFQEVRDEMVCGVERCFVKVSIVDLWTCDYEVQHPSTNVFCTSDAKNSGATIGILSISVSLLLIAFCLKYFSEPEKNDTDYEQGLDKS